MPFKIKRIIWALERIKNKLKNNDSVLFNQICLHIYIYIYIYIYILEVNNGNKFKSMKKIEKQSNPKVINS